MNFVSFDSEEELSTAFDLHFLIEAPLKRLIELSEKTALNGVSIAPPKFPLRFGGWLQRSRTKTPRSREIILKDILKLNISDIKNAPNVGQGTFKELLKFLHWLEQLVAAGVVDSHGNPILFSTDNPSPTISQGWDHFLNSDRPLGDVINFDGIDFTKIEDVWTQPNKVSLYGRSYQCEILVPVRFYNLLLNHQKCIDIFKSPIVNFSDLLKLNRTQLKSIKGISADSEQLFFEHLLWLAEANRKASKNSTFFEFIDQIVGELSFAEKYVLERRSVFSGTDSFREIQAGLKAEHGMTVTAEMCRRYLLSAQKKIEKSISGPGSSRVLEAFGKIDSFLTVERSLLEVENEFHFQVKGSHTKSECTCEFCEKDGRFSIHIYSSVRESVKSRDDSYFIDGYGWEQLKSQLFAESGLVELEEFAVFCNGKNIHQHRFLEDLLNRGVLQIGNFVVDPIPMVNVMEAVLKVEKRPISIGECVEKYGVERNLRSFRNAVASDERFIRVSKDEFAFAGDEYEVYEGIAREMEKVLQKSGRMLLSRLQSELKSKKNINPTSVLFFSSAPIFGVENGFISIRESSNMLREFPREVDGESWIIASGEIELRFLCDKELLRGSGMSIGAGTAALLGVQPGGHKTYLLGEHEIEVSWSVYSINPRISSLRNIAIALNAERSNVLRLRFYEVSSSATGRVTTS